MADSQITKRALASALQELMEEKNFSRISVSDICDKCGMNRKSFYYHFHDKYDLVNWIFDTDFSSVLQNYEPEYNWTKMEALCRYFYENRSFYRKALKIEGQNSFTHHFHSVMYDQIHSHLEEITHVEHAGEFQVNFFSDAVVMTFQRWLLNPNCMEPEDFLLQLKLCVQCMADQGDMF